jgi:response regulator RpfG family c-di-GMP phosphodiesterase
MANLPIFAPLAGNSTADEGGEDRIPILRGPVPKREKADSQPMRAKDKEPSEKPGRAEIIEASGSKIEGEPAVEDRILFVDDEQNVLDGYKRLLHDQFRIEVVPGGGQALAAIHLFGPYAIVISDMHMPGMNGAEFLAQVRQLAPNTVRMLLTGFKDINLAIEAVNEGRIFRYLTKPCEKKDLVNAIELGLLQYHANVEARDAVKEAKEIKMQAQSLSKVLLSHNLR